MPKVRIKLNSTDIEMLNSICNSIKDVAKKSGISISGPIPLPTKIQKFCVLRGPHVDKDSREQFEIRSSKRLLIISPTTQTVDALMKLNLSAGVNIKIALNENKN